MNIFTQYKVANLKFSWLVRFEKWKKYFIIILLMNKLLFKVRNYRQKHFFHPILKFWAIWLFIKCCFKQVERKYPKYTFKCCFYCTFVTFMHFLSICLSKLFFSSAPKPEITTSTAFTYGNIFLSILFTEGFVHI